MGNFKRKKGNKGFRRVFYPFWELYIKGKSAYVKTITNKDGDVVGVMVDNKNGGGN